MKRVSHLPLLRVNVSSVALHVAMCNWKNTVCSDKVYIKTVAQFCKARVISRSLKSLLNMEKAFHPLKDQMSGAGGCLIVLRSKLLCCSLLGCSRVTHVLSPQIPHVDISSRCAALPGP